MSKAGGVLQRTEYIVEAVPEPLSLFICILDGFESGTKEGKHQEQIEKREEEVFLNERHLDFSLRNHTLQHRKP